MALWTDAILRPKETFASEKVNANLKGALINYAIIPLIGGLIYGIILALFAQIIGSLPIPGLSNFAPLIKNLGWAAIIVLPILSVIIAWIGAYIGIGVLNAIAKAFGGTGNFLQTFYIVSLVTPLLTILGGLLGGLKVYDFELGNLISFIISIYFAVLILKEVHGLTTGKSILTLIVSLIAFLIIFVIISIIFAAIIAAFFISIFAGAALKGA